MQFQDTKFKELDAKGLITDKLNQIKEFEIMLLTMLIKHFKVQISLYCNTYKIRLTIDNIIN